MGRSHASSISTNVYEKPPRLLKPLDCEERGGDAGTAAPPGRWRRGKLVSQWTEERNERVKRLLHDLNADDPSSLSTSAPPENEREARAKGSRGARKNRSIGVVLQSLLRSRGLGHMLPGGDAGAASPPKPPSTAAKRSPPEPCLSRTRGATPPRRHPVLFSLKKPGQRRERQQQRLSPIARPSASSPSNTGGSCDGSELFTEREYWFLDSDQVLPAESPLSPLEAYRRTRDVKRQGYAAYIMRRLKENRAAQAAFAVKVERVATTRKQKLSGTRSPRPAVLLSPQNKHDALVRRMSMERRHRQHVFDLAATREEQQYVSKTEKAGERQATIALKRDMMCHLATLVVFANSVCAIYGAVRNATKPKPKTAKCVAVVRTAFDVANRFLSVKPSERMQHRLLAKHAWVFRMWINIRRKRKASRVVRKFLDVEWQRIRVKEVVKRLRKAATAIQRWWASLQLGEQARLALLGAQWNRVLALALPWSAERIHKYEADTAAALQQAGSQRSRSPRARPPAKVTASIQCAKFVMALFSVYEVPMRVPDNIRDSILRVVIKKQSLLKKLSMIHWQSDVAAATMEYKMLEAVISAKIEIQTGNTQEDGREKLEAFDWPQQPWHQRLLHADEVRLAILLGYEVLRQQTTLNAEIREGLTSRVDAECSNLIEEEAAVQSFSRLQGSLRFPGVKPNFLQSFASVRKQLAAAREEGP
ncbi:hypothetical protein DIPPA_06876 [Diplonema papillatum]|nr:hypothetical protein DIPPA_06876 [Diplonema papillatum]